MDKRLKNFLAKQHLLSLALKEPHRLESNGGQSEQAEFYDGVYCASCFYAFDMSNLALLIKSEPTTRHIQLAQTFSIVGVNIAKNTLKLMHIKGAQIRARFHNASKQQEDLYYQKFPYAKAINGQIYALEILWAKYTDNRFFGKSKVEFLKQ